MSKTAITIRTDDDSKKAISDFAASLGLSTSAFATAVLLQAVREQKVVLSPTLEPTPYLEQTMRQQKVVLSPTLEPTPYLEQTMRQAEADRIAGKNIRSFDNPKDAISHLRSL